MVTGDEHGNVKLFRYPCKLLVFIVRSGAVKLVPEIQRTLKFGLLRAIHKRRRICDFPRGVGENDHLVEIPVR